MIKLSNEETSKIISLYTKKGYKLYGQPLSINLFGIRNLSNKDANTFNDTLGFIWFKNNAWEAFTAPATTDPGNFYRENPSRVSGTAILCPGQHLSSFTFGLHHNSYECLVQKIPVKVFRDANKDSILDFTGAEATMSGIHIHRASATHTSTQVDNWSAGCQVFANPKDFDEYMLAAHESAKIFGNTFTYTLFEV